MNASTGQTHSKWGEGFWREFGLIFVVFACALLVVGGFHFYYKSRSLDAINAAGESTSVALGRSAIENRIGNVKADLLFLSQNATNLGLFDSPLPGLRQQLKLLFLTLIKQHSEYDQVRYLDENGKEVVRVNYNNGRPFAVPDSLLQDKRNRYYFGKTWALDKGEVYLSPMDLNIEQGKIEEPIKPVLRFSTPVFNSQGRKLGVLVINYLGKVMLDNFRQVTVHVGDHIHLVNPQGFWLSHPDQIREWGFMFGLEHTFEKERPKAWALISSGSTGQQKLDTGLFSFDTIDLEALALGTDEPAYSSGSHQWKVISHLTPKQLSAMPGFLAILPVYAISLALLGIASFLIARARVRHREIAATSEFEQRFRLTLENIDLLAVSTDVDGQIKFCNDTLLQLTGWNREDVLGDNWFERFIPEGQIDGSKELFSRTIEQKTVTLQHDGEIHTKAGELLNISWNDTLMLDADAEVIGLTSIGENVTEAIKTERELKKLSRAVEQSPSTVMIVDTEGKIEYVNPKFSRLTGYTREEVIGENPSILKSGETEIELYQELWNTILEGKEWRGVFQNRKKNGELYWESAVISPLRGRSGKITHYIAVKEDITEKLRLERRFQQVFEAAPNAMIMVDHEGFIVLANSEAVRCFGYSHEELVGRSVNTLLPEQFQHNHPEMISSYLKNPSTRKLGQGRDLFGKHKDGSTLQLEIGLSPLQTKEGMFVLCSFVDTSERHRLARELELSNQEIARAETLATVGRMANMVAHDLRNPLSSVKMGLQILGKKPTAEWGEQENELRGIALEQVHYMERIMQDLLSYSRDMKLNAEWIQLDKLIDGVILLTQREISEKQIKINTWHQPGLPTLHGDPDKLRQVFSNLVLNSINATESNSATAEISISSHLVLNEDYQSIRVEIADRGSGIPKEIADKIFEPFFTTRSKGTGLGLAIVQKIVEAHGGEIHFEETDEKGARAIVTLPTILPDERHTGMADELADISQAQSVERADLLQEVTS